MPCDLSVLISFCRISNAHIWSASVFRSQTDIDTEPSGIKLASISCETCRMYRYLFLKFVGSAVRLESWSCDVSIRRAMFVAGGGSLLALRLGGHISLIDASHLLANSPQGAPGKKLPHSVNSLISTHTHGKDCWCYTAES